MSAQYFTSHRVCAPIDTLTSNPLERPETPRASPMSSPDAFLLSTPKLRPSSLSPDSLTDSEHLFTPTSSAESFELDAIATSWPSRADDTMPGPSSIVCTTDGEDEKPRTVWSSSPRKLKSFWRDAPFTPPRPPRRLPSPRSLTPESSYTQSSSPAPRSSSDHSFSSGPSIRVTESPQVPSRLSFIESEDSLLEPPISLARTQSPSNDSVSTVKTPRPFKLKSAPSSPAEPSPVARKRRLNALRGLVPSLNFDQPWSVINRSEAEDQAEFWACAGDDAPQLHRLSLGTTFKADDISLLANESTLSLPATSEARKEAKRRSKRISRSMTSIQRRFTDNPVPHWPERPISPPMSWTPPVRSFAVPAELKTRKGDLSRNGSIARTNSLIRKSSSVRNLPREPPRPPRRRKESFNVQYSGYSKSLRPLTPRVGDIASTWRESLVHNTVYDRVLSGPDGRMEVKRQEVMWEMCETEQAFVRACRDVVRLFAAPLRVAQGEWMSGISDGVCDLFDVLEVIAHAHSELAAAQQVDRRESDVVDVGAFAAQFRGWVDRLACHEPYIVSFYSVTEQIEAATRDDSSTFGEFLRMQMRDKALGSLSLGSMLLKPIQRLTKYPLFLRRLLEATPETHPAHDSVAELLEHTEAVLGGLEACKAAEDEFLQLCALEERLDGLPRDFELAVRGRRLIGHAQVIRIQRETDGNVSRSTSLHALRAALSSASRVPSAASVHTGSSRSMETKPRQPTSASSAASSVHAPSRGPSRPASRAPSRTHSRAASPIRERSIHRTVSIASSLGDTFRTPAKPSFTSFRKANRDNLYTAMIFNDMVLLTKPALDRQGLFKTRATETARFRVLSAVEGGIGTVDDVREIKDWSGHERLFALGLRAPDGHAAVATFVLAPLSSMLRRAQRVAGLAGTGMESMDQVMGALTLARGINVIESEDQEHE